MDWTNDPTPTKAGRVVRSFGQDLESVLFAVVAFLSGGCILFVMCFLVTKCMQCYKARLRRKRRRALGEDDDDDDELEEAVLSGAFRLEHDSDEEEQGGEHEKEDQKGRLVDL